MWAQVGARASGAEVFISYGHVDNRPLGPGQPRFVEVFHEMLKTRLEQLSERGSIRTWCDPKLKGNDELTEAILEALRSSRVFVCVLTPRYLASDWCQRELNTFVTEILPAARPGAGKPIFKVIKTPVERERQPGSIRELMGYDFYQETADGRIREFGIGQPEFVAKVDDIAQDIQKFLKAGGSGRGDEPSSGRTVYLAETTGDLKVERDKIRRELAQWGYRVLPERPFAMNAGELVPQIEADLGEACLTVHAVGSRYGFIPEGEDRSIVELQLDLASARNGHRPHVIWVPPEAQPADSRQKEFLDRLRREYTDRAGVELLDRKAIEDLKTRLVQKLRAPAPVTRAPESNLLVYLVCGPAEEAEAGEIRAALESQGYSVQLPLMESDEQTLRKDHEDTWTCCDAVLYYYGAESSSAWLRAKQRDVWKAPGWGRKKAPPAQAVYVARPAGGEQMEHMVGGALILEGEQPFAPRTLVPFLERIGRAKGAAA